MRMRVLYTSDGTICRDGEKKRDVNGSKYENRVDTPDSRPSRNRVSGIEREGRRCLRGNCAPGHNDDDDCCWRENVDEAEREPG